MANDVMIEAQKLTKHYGSFRALAKVTFQVKKGEVVGFLGPNGAGKSTTMRILTCFLSASEGVARVHGMDVFESPLEVRHKVGYLPQRAPLYGEMRVWDYLQFAAQMRGMDDGTFKSRMKTVVEVCGLAKVLGKDIRTLSHGYRQRVGLGQALVHDPPVLILDEPTSDLDPNEKAEVIRYIKEIGRNRTVLLSTHNLSEVEAACARAIIVSKGRIVADGSLEGIRAKSGKVRYVVTVHEKKLLGKDGPAPSAEECQEALGALDGVLAIRELPTDDKSHSFELAGALETDLREALFQLIVQKGWLLLEMRRESQTLEDVFKALTRGDERGDRGRALLEGEDSLFGGSALGGAAAAAAAADEDDDDDEDEDEDDDEDDDEQDSGGEDSDEEDSDEEDSGGEDSDEEDSDDEDSDDEDSDDEDDDADDDSKKSKD